MTTLLIVALIYSLWYIQQQHKKRKELFEYANKFEQRYKEYKSKYEIELKQSQQYSLIAYKYMRDVVELKRQNIENIIKSSTIQKYMQLTPDEEKYFNEEI